MTPIAAQVHSDAIGAGELQITAAAMTLGSGARRA